MNTKDVQKCSQINDPLDTLFTERVSLVLAKKFAKHGVKPNTVTILSIISGVIGAVFFVFHNIWLTIAGILLEILAAIFDCADGQVARITHKGSRFGRFFDGFGDSVVYTSIYIAISIRIMSEVITFTGVTWSWWIWLVTLPVGIYFHGRQARLADYVKQLHMHFCNPDHHSELESTKSLTEEYKNVEMNWFQKFITNSYISYTKSQEHYFPNTQKLLAELNGEIPEKMTEMYAKKVRFCKLSNCLVFNLRTYVLFALLILSCFLDFGATAWIFVFVVFVLEPITLLIEYKYEHLAKKALKEVTNK